MLEPCASVVLGMTQGLRERNEQSQKTGFEPNYVLHFWLCSFLPSYYLGDFLVLYSIFLSYATSIKPTKPVLKPKMRLPMICKSFVKKKFEKKYFQTILYSSFSAPKGLKSGFVGFASMPQCVTHVALKGSLHDFCLEANFALLKTGFVQRKDCVTPLAIRSMYRKNSTRITSARSLVVSSTPFLLM